MLIAGARPNFVKIKPVLAALEGRGIDTFLVHTGQHYDAKMSDVFFDELGIRHPDAHLEVGSGTHAEQTARVMLALEPLVLEHRPDVVAVVGDVNSTLGAALVGAKCGCKVAHIEAGLRSRDWTMPEEINRVSTDSVSDYLFAPSPDGVVNLRAEGFAEERIFLVGNVMIDTLLSNVERARRRPVVADLGLEPGGYGLVTLHRPANVDDPAVLDDIIGALVAISERLPLVFPAHPRVADRLAAMASDRIVITEPKGYLDFIALEASARVALTDSGGVQEETTALGIPCLTLRDNTERPVTVDEGTNVVVGRDPARILAAFDEVMAADGAEPRRPELWDGHAADRIVDALLAAR
jgi:UDP-N-acetylglucosamine 2-epimerase (non-hydrolysing)